LLARPEFAMDRAVDSLLRTGPFHDTLRAVIRAAD
jgi:hypothetical protein